MSRVVGVAGCRTGIDERWARSLRRTYRPTTMVPLAHNVRSIEGRICHVTLSEAVTWA